MSATEAQGALLRKYLHAYGPATLTDFSHWSGISMQEVKALHPLIERELAEIPGEKKSCFLLREDVAALSKSSGKEEACIRLLPIFDSYLLAHRDKDHLLSARPISASTATRAGSRRSCSSMARSQVSGRTSFRIRSCWWKSSPSANFPGQRARGLSAKPSAWRGSSRAAWTHRVHLGELNFKNARDLLLPPRHMRIAVHDRELRGAGAQSQLGTRPGYPVFARHRFLQAADAAVYLEALPQDAGAVHAVQSFLHRPRRHFRARRTHRANARHARAVRFRRSELVWLAGNTFYGRRGIFEPAFLEWLERDFRLSDYELSVKDGRFHLTFDGLWTDTTMWELYSLSIINELRTRANLKKLSEFGLDILYAKAKTKLWSKIERLRGVPNLNVADFGTRRRHSFLWQEYVVDAMATNLGSGFTGTSNAFLAHKHDLEAIGTNAHEIPMVLAALAPG